MDLLRIFEGISWKHSEEDNGSIQEIILEIFSEGIPGETFKWIPRRIFPVIPVGISDGTDWNPKNCK